MKVVKPEILKCLIPAILLALLVFWPVVAQVQEEGQKTAAAAGQNGTADKAPLPVKEPEQAAADGNGQQQSAIPQADPAADGKKADNGETTPETEQKTATEEKPEQAAPVTAEEGKEAASSATAPAGEKPAQEGQAGEARSEAAESTAASNESDSENIVQGTVEKGDTLSQILEKATSGETRKYIEATAKVFSLRSFRIDQPYTIVTDADQSSILRFEYEIDNHRRLVVEGAENPVARVEPIEYATVLHRIEANISDNLFLTISRMGEQAQLALQLAELFGSEINFIRDLTEKDSFSVLIEKRYREGAYKGYGRILAATFTNKGKTFEAFLYRIGTGRAQYYNRKGENLRKTLLQAPLAFTRLTSRFSYNRKHPILGHSRAHLGVDYAAPKGTPVKAVGDGVVTVRGWIGGYGNQVAIRHTAGLESMYSHLSGFARGLAKGQRVRQGQVIGFVGSTGLSTGPHLDFRLKQGGRFINPVKAINPRGEPVPQRNMADFRRIAQMEEDLLAGRTSLENYDVESIVPPNVVQAEAQPEPKPKPARRSKGRRSQ